MADPRDAGKISNLTPLDFVTGDELMEVVARDSNGVLKNYRLLINKIRTNQGLSAYEVALKNGFVGTEQEWLDSLHGQSAYQLAKTLGFVGTEQEWLDSLVGPGAYETAVEEGFVGTKEEWLLTMHGQSAYQLAVQQGFVGNEDAWLKSLHGDSAYVTWLGLPGNAGKTEAEFIAAITGRQGIDGKSAYEGAVEAGYVGSEEKFYKDLSYGGVAGAVFITDITPQNPANNVGSKVYDTDGVSLISCLGTTKAVIVKVRALTGHSSFRPVVKVNGLPVTVTAVANTTYFEGTVNVTVPADDTITATHQDGAEWLVTMATDAPPVITSATFKSVYPAGQTEVKEDDLFNVGFVCDVPVVAYEIQDTGALKASTGTFTSTTGTTINGRQVANRGNVVSTHGFTIRVQKSTGAWSAWYNSATGGSVELTNVIKLNNLHPGITFGSITYPVGQTALKGTEAATVANTVVSYDTIQYSSAQLTIAAPTVYASAKGVTRLTGTYNVSTDNFQITATRRANGAVTVASIVVAIADATPIITVTTPAARLRSGGSNGTAVQSHVITISSDQALETIPTMNAPEGTWVGAGFVANAAKTSFTRTLNVADSNAKGVFAWNSLVVKSRSGILINTISTGANYTLGGFVFRTLTVPAFPNREAALGTEVALTAKLRCTNLSKGQAGSLNTTYQNNLSNVVDRYTITGPTGVLNPTGNLWYNSDGANATSNTSGTMQIEIEEVV